MEWGTELPPECPPDGHGPAEGVFYRLADPRHAQGDTTDESSWVLPVNYPHSTSFGQVDDCHAYGLSVFDNIDVLHAARRALRWARKKSIARVVLEPSMGRILAAPSDVGPGHYDWWPTPLTLTPPADVVEGAL